MYSKTYVVYDAAMPLKSTEQNGVKSVSWTFLTNHSHVLICLALQPDLLLREVAERVGITERAVQKIVHELEQADVLVRTKEGRRNRYQILENRALRHPVEGHRRVADLINMVRGETRP